MDEAGFLGLLEEIAGLDGTVFEMGAQRFCSKCEHRHTLSEVDQRPSWGKCQGQGCHCHVLYPESPASRARRAIKEL